MTIRGLKIDQQGYFFILIVLENLNVYHLQFTRKLTWFLCRIQVAAVSSGLDFWTLPDPAVPGDSSAIPNDAGEHKEYILMLLVAMGTEDQTQSL